MARVKVAPDLVSIKLTGLDTMNKCMPDIPCPVLKPDYISRVTSRGIKEEQKNLRCML